MTRRRTDSLGSAAAQDTGRTQRDIYRAYGDAALVEMMRRGDPHAWGEFILRFRPVLERFARYAGIPAADWHECVDEVMEDEAERLVRPGAKLPVSLPRFLVGAASHKFAKLRRAHERRQRRYRDAASHAVYARAARRVRRWLETSRARRLDAP